MQAGRQLVWKIENLVTDLGGREFYVDGHGTVAVLAYGLGITFGSGFFLFWLSTNWIDFGAYVFFLSFFHWSEYILVAMHRKDQLSGNSFLINHSVEYTVAFMACLIEYLVEWLFFPSLKNNWFIYWPGILLTAFGLVFRVLSQHHARQSFTHEVQTHKRDVHKLVTDGVYKYVRHPGYFGWFWYTVGTQVILANPICLPLFAFVSFRFFKDRIEYEEEKLVEFFGNEYQSYRARTPVYIPGIN